MKACLRLCGSSSSSSSSSSILVLVGCHTVRQEACRIQDRQVGLSMVSSTCSNLVGRVTATETTCIGLSSGVGSSSVACTAGTKTSSPVAMRVPKLLQAGRQAGRLQDACLTPVHLDLTMRCGLEV
jgi:hypothetical protein